MSSRDIILKAINANKPTELPMPSTIIEQVAMTNEELLTRFCKTLESIGGQPMRISSYEAISVLIQETKTTGEKIVNTVSEVGEITAGINTTTTAVELEGVNRAMIKGTIGIAENAAIWVKESQAVNRLLPFICQHLVLVINTRSIVATMQDAYQQIDIAEEGFGVFIAGPSKTADIEQALVIGAHGPRSLVVLLIDDHANQ